MTSWPVKPLRPAEEHRASRFRNVSRTTWKKAYNDRYQLLKYMAAFSGSAEQPKAAEPKVTE